MIPLFLQFLLISWIYKLRTKVDFIWSHILWKVVVVLLPTLLYCSLKYPTRYLIIYFGISLKVLYKKATTYCCVINGYFDLTISNIFSITHCAYKNRQICTQRVPKEAQRCELPTSIIAFLKIFWYTWTAGCQTLAQYIRME